MNSDKWMRQMVQLEKTQRNIGEEGRCDLQIYNDCFTIDGTSNNGAGMVVVRGHEVFRRWHAATET